MDSKDSSNYKLDTKATKCLIEISQKENYYDSGNSDNELDAWVYIKPQKAMQNTKPLSARPSTALGKPPRSSKPNKRVLNKPNIPKPKNLIPTRVYLVPPVTRSFSLKPPIEFNLQFRSSSLKSEPTVKKPSLDRTHTNDINFTYRRKMLKYKLLRQSLDKEKNVGLNFLNFPRLNLLNKD